LNLTKQLSTIIEELEIFQAEVALMIGAMLLLLLVRASLHAFVLKGLVSIVLIIAYLLIGQETGSFFQGWVFLDPISIKMKGLLVLTVLIVVWFIKKPHHIIEYYFFLLSGLVGAMIMMTGRHFLIIYLSIELASFSSYFMTGLRQKAKSAEATMKYVLFGGVTSSVMLYGMSLMYGASGSLFLQDWVNLPFAQIGLILFFAGLFFKASLVPFHLWVPSTFQEAPSDVVAYFVVVPKIAAFILIYHILDVLPGEIKYSAIKILMAVSLITVIWGTFSAIPQERLKRMIAFGAIAHSGFMLPLVLMGDSGLHSFSIYAVAYAIMNVGVFFIVQFHEGSANRSIKFDSLEGFGRQSPLFAGSMVIFLLALIGLPPTGGFTAKLLLFSNIYHQYIVDQEIIWLIYLVIGVLSSALALYYYLKIPVSYFLKEGTRSFESPKTIQLITATILAVLMLWVFIQPEILNSFVI
jgi:NADH-quinone oxidoreductase subunit N